MRIPLETQRSVYQKHARTAADLLIAEFEARIDEMVALGLDRAFDEVGVHEYGDSTYWKSSAQLDEETAAELADAIFYRHISLARSIGDLPPANSQ